MGTLKSLSKENSANSAVNVLRYPAPFREYGGVPESLIISTSYVFFSPRSDSVELILGTGFALAFLLAVILHNILPEEDDPKALRDVRTHIAFPRFYFLKKVTNGPQRT